MYRVQKIDHTRLRAVIGALAHICTFTTTEITEYTRWDSRRLDKPSVVRYLLVLRLVSRLARGAFIPGVRLGLDRWKRWREIQCLEHNDLCPGEMLRR